MISIRRQLTRELLVAFLLLLGGALAALYISAREELIEQFDDALRAKSAAISSLTFQEPNGIHVDASDQLFRSFTREHPHDFFEIRSIAGAVLARSDSLAGADLPQPDRPLDRPRFWNIRLPDGRPGRAMAIAYSPMMDEDEWRRNVPRSQLLLVVASDSEPLVEALTELLTIGAACGVLGLAVTAWVVSRVLRRGLQPLARLGEQTARINADSLAERFPAGDMPAELQPIVNRLNELLARLEISFERERRFSADLAHELRTPLAELRSLAESALKWPDSRDHSTDEEVLAAAIQMQTMVSSLLALARAEQHQLVAAAVPVDLFALVHEVWHPHTVQAEARRLKLRWNLSPATVLADPALLRSVLGNLFENAVDYAAAGGEIEISLEVTGPEARVRVANTVENLGADDVAKMFDRFWRKEEARSGGKHFGLGLSLARMFAEAMGWKLTAALDARGRLEFALDAPGEQS